MSLLIAAGLLVAVFFTSLLSGIFGMAGGLVLLAILLAILPVGTAIAVQGAIQIVANGSRAWFSRAFIDWRVLGFTLGVSVLTGLIFGLVPAFHSSKSELVESLKEGGRGTGESARPLL